MEVKDNLVKIAMEVTSLVIAMERIDSWVEIIFIKHGIPKLR